MTSVTRAEARSDSAVSESRCLLDFDLSCIIVFRFRKSVVAVAVAF